MLLRSRCSQTTLLLLLLDFRCVSKQSSTRVPRLTSIPGVPEQSSTTSLLLLLRVSRRCFIRQRCRPAERFALIRREFRAPNISSSSSSRVCVSLFLSRLSLAFSLRRGPTTHRRKAALVAFATLSCKEINARVLCFCEVIRINGKKRTAVSHFFCAFVFERHIMSTTLREDDEAASRARGAST